MTLKDAVLIVPEVIEQLFQERNKQRLDALYGQGKEMFDETQEFVAEIADDARAAAEILIDLFLDLADVDDVKPPVARSLANFELRGQILSEVEKRTRIITDASD